jgi:hypothetical protein
LVRPARAIKMVKLRGRECRSLYVSYNLQLSFEL